MTVINAKIIEECKSIWMQFFPDQLFDESKTFIEQGGSSLNLVLLVWNINEKYSIEIDIEDILKKPTFATLLALVSRAGNEGERSDGPEGDAIGGSGESRDTASLSQTASDDENAEKLIENKYTPSSSQKRLWFIDKVEGASAKYNVVVGFDITGQIEIDLIRKAMNQTLKRHDALRSNFIEKDGEPVVVLDSDASAPVSHYDLSDLPASEVEGRAAEIIDRESHYHFDLARDVLIRVVVIGRGSARSTLIINMHHIISDGWSLSLITQELSRWYKHYLDGESEPEEAKPVQYSRFSRWQNSFMQSESYTKQIDYWKSQLEGIDPDPGIPLDFDRPEVPAAAGAMFRRDVPVDDFEALRGLARDRGVTVFVVLQALYALLLSRWSNRDDISIGVPYAGRKHKDYQHTIGFFANTLVIRNWVAENKTLGSFLDEAGNLCRKALAHQDVPFDRVVEELKPPRKVNLNPFFQTFFALQDNEEMSLEFAGAEAKEIVIPMRVAKFDLSLHIFEGEKQVVAHWEFNNEIFSRQRMIELAEQFEYLVGNLTQNVEKEIGKIDIIPPAQAALLNLGYTGDIRKPISQPTVHALFSSTCYKTPEKPALRITGRSISYRALEGMANAVASYLVNMGVAAGDFIGIYASRSVEMIAAVLGVMKAGAVYCPLDLKHPQNRIRYIVEDANIRTVLVHSDNEVIHGLGVETRKISDLLQTPMSAFEGPEVTGESPAYLLYTSGSTGKPKGVVQTHQTICNLIDAQELKAGYTTLQFTPLTFDVSLQELATTWGCAAELVMISESEKDDIPKLPEILMREKIQRLFVPPALFNILCEDVVNRDLDLSGLREVILAGEALTISWSLKQFFKKYTNCHLWNHYGPTETHVVTIHKVDVANDSTLPPIGNVIDNCKAWILTKEGMPAPRGCAGELCISGAQVALGYCNNPGLTVEKFVDSRSAVPGFEKMYKTGDLVRCHNGTLEYLGRIDDQVKIRGFRIELGEVEKTLVKNSAVHQCVVTKASINATEALVAYLVLKQGVGPDAVNEISAMLKSELPAYMIPNQFICLEAFPLSRNGKVDKRALPEPTAIVRPEKVSEAVSASEKELAAIWAEIFCLKPEEIDIATSFFSLGGHSLLLVKLSNAIRRRFALEAKLSELFTHSTIQAQAAHIIDRERKGRSIARIPKRRGEGKSLPMSFQQKRMWFLDQLLENGAAYNVPIIYRLKGHLQVKVLQQAVDNVIARHDVLRTVYVQHDGLVKARLLDTVPNTFNYEKAGPDKANEAYKKAWMERESQTAFDLSSDAMMRVSVLELADSEYMFCLNMHHIATDGWTQKMILRELQSIYNGALPADPSDEIKYSDYAAWQAAELEDGAIKKSLNYWRESLANAPALHALPLDYSRPQVNDQQGETLFQDIPLGIVNAIDTLAEETQTTRFMVLQAVYALLIARWSLQDDVVIGTPISGRSHEQVEAIVGLFVNMIALRFDTSGNPRFKDYLSSVKNTVLAALENGDYPFELLVEKLISDRKANYNPIFQITFSMSTESDTALSLNNLTAENIAIHYKTSKVDLSLHIEERAGAFNAFWTFNSNIFKNETIERLSKTFGKLLEEIVLDQGVGIHSYEIIDKQQANRLMNDLGAGRTVERRQENLFSRFEQVARAQPNKPAVGFHNRELTYGELLSRSTALSRLLRDAGVTVGHTVGIHLDRSLELIVSMLATVKLGACFVTLDPEYPAERLDYMSSDSATGLVITSDAAQRAWPGSMRTLNYADLLVTSGEGDYDFSPHSPSLDCAAYIIYTSGSTGRPKGVAVSQRSLLNLCDWHINQYCLNSDASTTQMTEAGFDAAVWDIWVSLLSGARLQIVSNDERVSALELKRLIKDHAITHTFVPTGLLRTMAGFGVFDSPTLRYVLTGGDVLDRDVLAEYPNVTLVNHYGPTEAAVVTSAYQVAKGASSRPPIGRAIDNARVFVLNREKRLQPEGAPGELYIGGVGVALGYVGQGEKHSGAFLNSPFEDGAKLYRSGDLVRWTNDEQLAYIGRLDRQVKLRGYRIEPSEIEQVFEAQCGVVQAKVIFREIQGERQLTAFVTLTESDDSTEEKIKRIKRGAEQLLPSYMCPSQTVILDSFPLTVNGKIDLNALQDIDAFACQEIERREPETETEKELFDIWAEILETREFGTNDSFFDVGGHSLLAIKLIAEIESHFDFTLALSDLFQNQTINEQSSIIEAKVLGGKNFDLFNAQEEVEETEW